MSETLASSCQLHRALKRDSHVQHIGVGLLHASLLKLMLRPRMCQRDCKGTLAAESTYRPLGRTLVNEMSRMRLSTSLSMLRATPGYWIFMAALRPSCRVARCT